LKNHVVYPFVLLLPIILGLDGHFSRLDGLALIIAGGAFYYIALKNGAEDTVPLGNGNGRYKSFLMLLISMIVLLVGAHFTVTSATSVANSLGVSPILIGMLIVGLGTTMPELFFSLKSANKQDDALAVGDILGTVLADATIVVGILALVNPFFFPQKIIYITGSFMVAASFLLFRFMRSGRTLTSREARLLLVFWLFFVFIEFIANRY
jgi:cation:H+ antiporter